MNGQRTNRIPNASFEAMKAQINSKLDPDLLEEVATMNSQERLSSAAIFRRWSDQLIASAAELEPLEKLAMPGSAAN